MEKKSSGRTPSAGSGAKRAAGAPAKGGCLKLGAVYRDGAIGGGILGVPEGGFKAAEWPVIQLIDAYTFNFAYIGSRTTGNDGGSFLDRRAGLEGRDARRA